MQAFKKNLYPESRKIFKSGKLVANHSSIIFLYQDLYTHLQFNGQHFHSPPKSD